jgi:hypothetical protein
MVIVLIMLAGVSGDSGPGAPTSEKPSDATPPSADTPDLFIRDYAWAYKDTAWNARLAIPTAYYDFYRGRPHDRLENYAQYALSDYDRDYLKGLIDDFREAGEAKDYTGTDDVLNVLAFVQSMPYMPDRLTTGYDEYPRYPIETLVDGGGDCEDTAILAAAILNEMGYGTVLIRVQGHMALGVKCTDDHPGAYYEFEGARYYYLDTTCKGLGIGQVPGEYAHSAVTILPMARQPRMDANFSFRVEDEGPVNARCRVHCNVSNVGTGTARNATVYIAGLAPGRGARQAWAPDAYVSIGDVGEGAAGWVEATLTIPRNETTQIECVLYGDNFEPVEVKSGLFYL